MIISAYEVSIRDGLEHAYTLSWAQVKKSIICLKEKDLQRCESDLKRCKEYCKNFSDKIVIEKITLVYLNKKYYTLDELEESIYEV